MKPKKAEDNAGKAAYTVLRPLDHDHTVYPADSIVYLTDDQAAEHLAHQVIKPAVIEMSIEEAAAAQAAIAQAAAAQAAAELAAANQGKSA